MVEETLRFKESELEKKESLLRRMTNGVVFFKLTGLGRRN